MRCTLDHNASDMEEKVTKKERIPAREEITTTVAKLVVRCLENEGVRYVLGFLAKKTSIL